MKYNKRKDTYPTKKVGKEEGEELLLTSDLAFKAVFGRDRSDCKRVLSGLLNAILGSKEDQIKTLTFINPFNPQDYTEGKLSCMDIKLVTEGGTRISVEMQVVVETVFINRSLYYEAQLVTEELNEGDDYGLMDRSIFIGILADNLFEGPRVHRKYRMKDVESGDELSDLMELHFVELKKADGSRPPAELSEVEQWALYLRSAGREGQEATVEKLIKESEVIEVAEKLRREVSKDEELRARAFSRRLFQLDVKSCLNEAQREGFRQGIELGKERGLEQGLEEGLEQGLEEGLEQGRLEERRRIAKKLLKTGLSLEFVCAETELTAEEVKKLGTEE